MPRRSSSANTCWRDILKLSWPQFARKYWSRVFFDLGIMERRWIYWNSCRLSARDVEFYQDKGVSFVSVCGRIYIGRFVIIFGFSTTLMNKSMSLLLTRINLNDAIVTTTGKSAYTWTKSDAPNLIYMSIKCMHILSRRYILLTVSSAEHVANLDASGCHEIPSIQLLCPTNIPTKAALHHIIS